MVCISEVEGGLCLQDVENEVCVSVWGDEGVGPPSGCLCVFVQEVLFSQGLNELNHIHELKLHWKKKLCLL